MRCALLDRMAPKARLPALQAIPLGTVEAKGRGRGRARQGQPRRQRLLSGECAPCAATHRATLCCTPAPMHAAALRTARPPRPPMPWPIEASPPPRRWRRSGNRPRLTFPNVGIQSGELEAPCPECWVPVFCPVNGACRTSSLAPVSQSKRCRFRFMTRAHALSFPGSTQPSCVSAWACWAGAAGSNAGDPFQFQGVRTFGRTVRT